MRHKRAGLVAAAAAALLALGTTAGSPPASAASNGGGAVTGTLSCVDGTATMTFSGPVFAFNGNVGPISASGTTPGCIGSILVDSAGGDFTVEGPGLSCDFGGGWLRTGAHLTFILGGPCTFDNHTENVQFLGDGAIAADTFAAGVAVSPVL